MNGITQLNMLTVMVICAIQSIGELMWKGVSTKTNKEVTHKHHTFIGVLDELREMGYKTT